MPRSLFLAALWIAGTLHAQVAPDVTLDVVADGPALDGALGLKHAGDGSGRLFVVRQGGQVRIIDSDDNVLATPFIDVSGLLVSGGERGLLDIAFHPEYAAPGADGEGLFYLHFSSDGTSIVGTAEGDTVVAEFRVGNDPDVANTMPERIVLTARQDFANHNGGQMQFGPDGYLYIALGDGGSGGDPCERAQTLDPANLVDLSSCNSQAASLKDSQALLGKILRIDVDATTAGVDNDNLCAVGDGNPAEYAVPSNNPFAADPDACGEVFLYGLRNPWRFSFDRVTDDLWIGDVGQGQWEEIDLLEAPVSGGANLGWDCYEASSTFEIAGCPPDAELTFPVLEYDHTSTGGCSVTGGYRYRGPVASLQGRYVFGDFCSGDIWLADDEGGTWMRQDFRTGFGGLRSFGEDQAGNLYAVAGGTIYRFEGTFDDVLFESGFEG